MIPDIKLRDFNYACVPVEDLNKVNWDCIKGLFVNPIVKEGTILVETEDGAVTLRGATEVAHEWFMQKLCLIMGIPVPKMRIVAWDEPEHKLILYDLERASFHYEALYKHVKKIIDRPYLIVQEYIPGIKLVGMGPKRAVKIFNHLTSEGRDRLIKLGFIFVFDILVNNSDRFPFAWDNDGNPDTMIVKAKTNYATLSSQLKDPNDELLEFEHFYALDNKMTIFNMKNDLSLKSLQKYFIRIENFLNSVFLDLKKIMEAQIDPVLDTVGKIESIKKISNFIFTNTQYQLKEMQNLQIMIGIVISMENVCQLGIDRIGMMLDKLFMDPERDWRNTWNKNLDLVNLEVIADTVGMFQKFRGVYSEVIKWTKDITLNQYNV